MDVWWHYLLGLGLPLVGLGVVQLLSIRLAFRWGREYEHHAGGRRLAELRGGLAEDALATLAGDVDSHERLARAVDRYEDASTLDRAG